MPRISEERTRKDRKASEFPSVRRLGIHFVDRANLPDYKDFVVRQFESYITHHNYNADQIHFLRAVQSVFLQKRHLEIADLYEPPLDLFGADAVECWFTEKEVEEVVEFVKTLKSEV